MKITEKIKKGVKFFFDKVKTAVSKLREHPFLFILSISTLLELCLEILSRHSLLKAILFIFQNPVAFLFGISIIAITFIPTLFINRKVALETFIFLLWLGMGVTNFVVLFFRITPFSAMDIALITSVFSIIGVYLSVWQIVLLSALILGAIAFVIYLFIKLPKIKINIKNSILSACYIVILFSLTLFSCVQSKATGGQFSNLGNAYRDYGFTYCFSASIFSRGISRPDDYSKEVMSQIEDELKHSDSSITKPSSESNPNIILLQLESYFDVNYLKGITYSENPVPNLTELKENCPSGFLTVPSIGAGTANTEFEVLTGMNKAYFGIGEYPYKTILQKSSCESICYNLKKDGYSAHAIHNHYGTFYDRNIVFKNLGFDTFTPVEFMTNVELTPEGWEKDNCLPRYIDMALKSTENRDFVFAISVQGHGKYPISYEQNGYTPKITVSGIEDEGLRTQYEYYINMIHETDAILGELISMYENYNEPVMLVIYGDHIPNLDITEEQITFDSLLETEYAVWTNYTLNAKDADITAYQLSSKIMDFCGKNTGILTQLNSLYSNNSNLDAENYEYMLSRIQYDMLYGDSYIVDEFVPAEQLKYGLSDIKIESIDIADDDNSPDSLSIKGEGFNVWSVVYVNDKQTRTIYKDEHTLLINKPLSSGDIIKVAQVAKDSSELSFTKEFIYK